jgi:hypothetical protein
MKNLYLLLFSLLIAAIPATSLVAQGTETFESPLPINSTSWTNAGLTFSSSSANFDTDEFVGAGAGGSDRYIDNIDAPATGSIYSISITGGATLFTMQSMEVYVSSIATGDNPTDDGTMIFRGFNGVTEEFAYTKPMGTFPTDFTNNGFFLLDFSAIPGLGDVSGTNIDRLEIELTGAFQYFAVDNFAFDNEVLEADPPEVQSITVVGTPNSTATSVDFLVTFNENANMVTTDDFSVDATGGVTGSITGISGSGTMYTLTVSGISGEGTISIDLNGGTDIEDDLGNAGPPAFTAGEVHVVSRCFQETFESFTDGDFMWSSNGVVFSSGTANFNVEVFVNGGAGSSDQFLSNDADPGTGKVYTIAPTGPELFTVEAADFYLSSSPNGLPNPTDDGTLTLEGRLSGSTLYTIQKTSGFPTDFTVNNGFYTVDFATETGTDHSLTNIDELRITIGGAFQYIAMDNFEHCEEITAAAPPIVQSITLVGNPPANSASVDFEVIFNEDAVNVTTDDFSLDLVGTAVGTVNSISGSGNTYMVGVNGISGEGSLRLDLNPGTDIEDLSGNTPPDPFTDGERFIVSICDVETFEGLAIGTFTWTTNTVPWTAGSTDFGVDEFIGAGAGGSDRYIDNVTSPGVADVNSISITDTQMVKMGSMEIYVSSDPTGANPTDDGTLTIVGKLDGVDQYTVMKSTGFPTIFGSTHGFYLWDFATEGGVDNSMTDIDEIELTLGGAFQYLAVDNFKFCMDPPDETEVALAGGTLTITDINGGTSDDVFDLSVVGPNLRITNTVDRFLVSGAGVVEVDDNTVDVLLANITNGIVLNAQAGNDSYTQSTGITLPGGTNDYTVQNIETFTQSAPLDVGGNVTYGVTGAVALNTTTAGGDLSIAAVGNITDSGNTITVGGAASLNTGAAGNVNLTGPFNVTGMIDADGLNVTIFNTPTVPWVLNNISASAGDINVTNNSNGLTLTGAITANGGAGDAIIRSGGLGGISQSGGTILADDLQINTGGQTATMTQAGNDVNTINVGTGAATFTDVDAISITGINSLEQLSITASDISFSPTATVTLNGAGANNFVGNITANAGSQLNQNSGDVSFTGTTINLNNLQYNGAGGTSTNFDATTTTAGSALTFFNLLVNSGNYQTNAVTTFVNGVAMFGATANLIGTGTISGEVVIASGGTLAPGNSPGCLSTGNISFAAASTLSMEVLGPTPCTQHDQLIVTGTVTIDPAANLSFLGGYANAPADMIVLIDNDGADAISGTFNGLPEGTPMSFGGFTGFITYTGGDGNDVVIAADTNPPTAICQDITVQLDAAGNAMIVAADVDNGSFDPEGPVTLSIDIDTFTCADTAAAVVVTLTVTDGAGNVDTCTSNVTVEDNLPPVLNCTDFTVQLDASGQYAHNAADLLAASGATDNCGIASFNVTGPNPLTCAQVGTSPITIFVNDVNGNQSQCTVNITVEDNVPPTAVCQDITVQLDSSGNATITGADVDGGSTDACGIASLNVSPSTFDCTDVGPNTVTLTVTDNNGNTATCTAVVTVEDNIPPSITCPTDITVNNDAGVCEAVVTYVTPVGTDNCAGATTTQTAGLPSGSAFPVGTTTNTFEVTDANGNTVSCSFDVTVIDAEDPTISCPADITVNNDPGVCGATVNYVVTGTDNCTTAISGIPPQSSVFTGNARGYWFTAPFDIVITGFRVPDDASSAVQNVQVMRFAAPPANFPGNSSYDALLFYAGSVPGNSFIPANVTISAGDIIGILGTRGTNSTNSYTNAGDLVVAGTSISIARFGTQNDIHAAAAPQGTFFTEPVGVNPNRSRVEFEYETPIISQTAGLPSGSVFPIGTTTNTFVSIDGAGNSVSCSFDVTVNDTEAPTITCPADINVNNDPGLCSAVVTYTVTSSDNCPGETIVQTAGLPSGSAFPVGTTTNTFVVTDASGNTATCSFDVIVTDNEPPVAVCMDITVQLDANGMASITPADVDGGSTDNCGIASLSVTPSSFDCTDVGANTVTLTVTDTSGNSSSCTATVTVEDNVPPVAMCVPDFTLPLDATGNASITPADIDNGSTDACGIASLSISPSTFTCADVGPNTVTLTVTDVNGNVSTCTTVVTVEDVTPPSIACPADVNTTNDPGICGATVFFADAIATDECGVMSVVQTMGPPSGSVFPIGTTTIEYTATDVNGNTNTCTFDITVTDDEPPVAVCMDITIQLDAAGNASITPADVDGGSTDNCGIASMTVTPNTFTCADVGPNNVILEVTDTSGNVSSCTAVVTVEDVTPPVAVCQDITVQLDANGMATITGADVDGGSTDSCGVASLSVSPDTFDCSNVGDNVVTLTVTDVNGNTSTCTAVVTVEDNIAPDLVCMDITLELDENGEAVITPDDVILTNTDACGIDTTAVDIFEFDCDDVGTPVTVTVFSIDVNGNISSCMAVVTVVDALAPVVTCPADQTVDPGPGNLFYTVPDYFANGEATATDNCTDPLTITSQDPAPGTQLSDGVYTVTICATDDSGNEGCCTFELTVESILGGNDPADLGTIVLYPNPATDVVNLSNPKHMELEQVAIYDMTGRLVKTIDLRGMGGEKALDISELASATYMFIINSEYGQMTKSIVKE